MGVKNICFQVYVPSFLFPSYIRSLFLPINVVLHPPPTHPRVWAVEGAGKVNTISNRTGGDNRYLSDKIMIYTNAWPRISVAITLSLIQYSEKCNRFFDRISYGKIRFSLLFVLFFTVIYCSFLSCFLVLTPCGSRRKHTVPAPENRIELVIGLFLIFCQYCKFLNGCLQIVSSSFV